MELTAYNTDEASEMSVTSSIGRRHHAPERSPHHVRHVRVRVTYGSRRWRSAGVFSSWANGIDSVHYSMTGRGDASEMGGKVGVEVGIYNSRRQLAPVGWHSPH